MKVIVISRSLSFLPINITHGAISVPPEQKVKFVRTLKLPFLLYCLGLSLFSFSALIALLKLIKISRLNGNKPIILHSQDTNFAAIATVLAGKILKVTTVIHQHGPYIELLQGKLMRMIEQSINKIVCKLSNAIIVTDKYTKKYFTKIVGDDEKIYVIPAAVDVSFFEDLKNKSNNNAHQNLFKIGYVGRLSNEKNLENLIFAFKDFKSNIGSFCKLVLVGDGELKSGLKQLAMALEIDKHVEFTGFQVNVKPFLSTFDVFILPSKIEGTPISLLEAMAAGKAIIASDIPSIREIVRHGEEAILVNPYNTEDLKQAILLLYNNPDLRARLGHRAKERAKLYDVNKVYGEILKLYEELARRKAKNTLQ